MARPHHNVHNFVDRRSTVSRKPQLERSDSAAQIYTTPLPHQRNRLSPPSNLSHSKDWPRKLTVTLNPSCQSIHLSSFTLAFGRGLRQGTTTLHTNKGNSEDGNERKCCSGYADGCDSLVARRGIIGDIVTSQDAMVDSFVSEGDVGLSIVANQGRVVVASAVVAMRALHDAHGTSTIGWMLVQVVWTMTTRWMMLTLRATVLIGRGMVMAIMTVEYSVTNALQTTTPNRMQRSHLTQSMICYVAMDRHRLESVCAVVLGRYLEM
jgi:hypothetical protein